MRKALSLGILVGLLGACSQRFGVERRGLQASIFDAAIASISDAAVVSFDQTRQSLVPGASADINWDIGAITALTQGATAQLPRDVFNSANGARQILIGAPGETLIASENGFVTLPGGASNPSSNGGFSSLTGTVAVTTMGARTLTLSFTTSSFNEAGQISGLGVVFTDVEVALKSGLRFYDANGDLIVDVRASAQINGTSQFIGALFTQPIVASVIIDLGDNTSFGVSPENPAGGVDHVIIDDIRFFRAGQAVPDQLFNETVTDLSNDVFTRSDIRRRALGAAEDINWDGSTVTAITAGGTANFPAQTFNNPANSATDRQIIIGGVTGDMGAVSQNAFSTLPGGGANPSAGMGLVPFSGSVNFSSIGSKSITLSFRDVSGASAGLIHGMQVVFTDVEDGSKSGLRFYDASGALLQDLRASSLSSGSHQILGALFPRALVAQVVIDLGDNDSLGTLAEDLNAGRDHVAIDDLRFFLAGTNAPIVEFSETVSARSDAIFDQFDLRRRALALGNEAEISWDEAQIAAITSNSSTVLSPAFFNNGSVSALDLQLNLGDAAQTLIVSDNQFATLPGGAANPSAGGGFLALSGTRNATTQNSELLTIRFFRSDTVTPGQIHGFGMVFSDVEKSAATALRFYDSNGLILRTITVTPGSSNGHRFVGAIFPSAVVARVELDLGDNGSFGSAPESPGTGADHVVIDDLLFFRDPR